MADDLDFVYTAISNPPSARVRPYKLSQSLAGLVRSLIDDRNQAVQVSW